MTPPFQFVPRANFGRATVILDCYADGKPVGSIRKFKRGGAAVQWGRKVIKFASVEDAAKWLFSQKTKAIVSI